MKSEKNQNNCQGGGQGKQAKKPNRPVTVQVQTRVILKMNASNPNENKIKESFKDDNGNEIKELIHTYKDGDRKENLLEEEVENAICNHAMGTSAAQKKEIQRGNSKPQQSVPQ